MDNNYFKDSKDVLGTFYTDAAGYWQVSGNQLAGYDRRIEMDLFYAENWSLLFDLKIFIKTPARVWHRSGG